jgi:hypothetical protein
MSWHMRISALNHYSVTATRARRHQFGAHDLTLFGDRSTGGASERERSYDGATVTPLL